MGVAEPRIAAGRPTAVALLGGIVEHVLAAARSDSSFARTLQERLGDSTDALGAVLPELAQSLGWKTRVALGPDAFAETRSIQALSALLDALGAMNRPALIILDDCQWADEMAIKLIAHWHGSLAGSPRNSPAVLMVVAFRSEEVGADHLLRKISPALHLRLAPFRADEVRRLLEIAWPGRCRAT